MFFKKMTLISLALFMCVAHAGEKSVYEFSWLDPDKEVYVLQNRKFRKDGHLNVNLGGGITTSGAFVDSKSYQARVGYFFTEDFGVEGIYALNKGEENDTAKAVRTANVGVGGGTTPFRRIVENYYGIMGMWSPFYSKINTFNKIVYVDWLFGMGYANLTEKNNRIKFESNGVLDGDKSESHSGLIWDVGLKFYLTEMWHIRADLTTVHYQAKKVSTGSGNTYYANYDASLSFGMNF